MSTNDAMKFLASLDAPTRRRIIATAITNAHSCARGAQIRCCEEFRCESCHMVHLNTVHSDAERLAQRKFSTAPYLISQTREISAPITKARLPRFKSDRTKTGVHNNNSLTDVFSALSTVQRRQLKELMLGEGEK